MTQALYALSLQLAAASTPASSSSSRSAWEAVWRQCCCASAGVFSMAGDGLQMTAGSDAFNVPPFTDRSSYWSAFGFAGGSPDDASPSALSASALASFCEQKALDLQGIMSNSSSGYPFCSTFLVVAASVFELIGLSDMHRYMNLLDSPSEPPLLQYLSRAECKDDMKTAVFELCFTAMQLFDFLWVSHHAHPSQLDSITKMTAALLAQTAAGTITSIDGFRSRLSTLAACLPNVALHLRLPEGVML